MFKPLDILLKRLVRVGDLTLVTADGARRHYGDGTGPVLELRLQDRRLERQLVLDPQLHFGEAYMDGRLTVAGGRIYDLLALIMSNAERSGLPAWTMRLDTLRFLARRLTQHNSTARARRNVSHHYDIRGELYDLFLDIDRQYSCAYFSPDAAGDLDAAQRAKERHITAKLAIRPGDRVLDIGCGWGGLALYMAKAASAVVDGITLSREQHAWAARRAEREGLGRTVNFRLEDYRETCGPYDRIVSVGMFEHVGVPHYPTYFTRIAQLLAEDGVALVHTIGRSEPPAVTNPFIAKYIFPGGYIPALSEIMSACERSGLVLTDVEILRLHYAETLKAWRERFLANWSTAARLLDERFCRMWEFYLAGSEVGFRHQKLVVFQLQLTRRIDVLPLTRDYIATAEQSLAAAERGFLQAEVRPEARA
jgi:cyclopropane-fatty-acyl-phospholipid synthase